MIRLVTFDALHTIITLRYPIHVQYSQAFEPYLGILPPESIKQSFNTALKDIQESHPSYQNGAKNWWTDVIRRTALGAGADERRLDHSLSDIVSQLMSRFNSREGYKAFDDAIPTINSLRKINIRTAVISNGDKRIRNVLKDLDFPDELKPIILSEEENIEKPSRDIFMRTLELVNQSADLKTNPIQAAQSLHIGDELICDYNGAFGSGWKALLLRRVGPQGEGEDKEANEILEGVHVIRGLDEVVTWVTREGK